MSTGYPSQTSALLFTPGEGRGQVDIHGGGEPLSGDGAAGDAGPGVPRGIADVIIRMGVNHQGGPAFLEKGVLPRLQGDLGRHRLQGAPAVRFHHDVGQVPGVGAGGTLAAVFLAHGIEMAAGAGKIRGRAHPLLMNMESVGAGRQVLHVHDNLHPLGGLRQGGFPHLLPLAVHQHGIGREGRAVAAPDHAHHDQGHCRDHHPLLHPCTLRLAVRSARPPLS